MPSQEDYLDNLLKNVATSEEGQDTGAGPDIDMGKNADASVDIDTVGDLTEEEIEKLLSAGAESLDEKLFGVSDMELPDEDVLKMLEESDDSDLREIQALLEKSDKNEAVDDTIAKLPQDIPEEELEAKILGDAESDTVLPAEDKGKAAREKKELERARREEKKKQAAAKKAEKKAAKEAAKEAARVAKAAAKAAQKAADDKKKKKRRHGQDAAEQFSEDWDSPAEESGDDKLFDMSVLDSIVSEADRGGQKSAQSLPDGASFGMDEDDGKEDGSASEEGSEKKGNSGAADDGGLGLDLGSLFGDSEADASLLEGEGNSDVDFPDFIALAGKESDALNNKSGKEEQGRREKKGLFSKILDLLTEEDEEEPENENIRLSQENQDILKDLDSEKGKKKKKGKKGKNAKKAKDNNEESKKEAKPKKAPKPKREPKPKKEPRETLPLHEKKLSFKKVFPVVLVGISLGVLLVVFANSAADYTDKRAARKAYYEEDYQTCYQNLFGKKLDETESVMYGKSESILYIRLWLREYEMFVEEGSEVEALDSLIQTVDRYPELYEYASQWNAGTEVASGYATILNILAEKYGLTESEAMEIAAVRSDVEYTRQVTAIARGKAFGSWNEPEPPVEPEGSWQENMQDKLPEEDELGQDTFIDNQ